MMVTDLDRDFVQASDTTQSDTHQLTRRWTTGVLTIDRVTIALNRLAACGSTSCAAAAWPKSTNPNSPPWLNSKPVATAGRRSK